MIRLPLMLAAMTITATSAAAQSGTNRPLPLTQQLARSENDVRHQGPRDDLGSFALRMQGRERLIRAYGEWGRCVVASARGEAMLYANATTADDRRDVERDLRPVFQACGAKSVGADFRPSVKRAAILDAL